MSGSHLSKEFFELVKSIGEAKSKQEEDRIILKEVATLKTKMAERDVSGKKMKEYLVRMIYCEMMGHEASFGYIHAVNLAHEGTLMEKRVGYLAVTACLHENHELMILLVNTLHKDLKSGNHLEVCGALTAVCKLINNETIPAVFVQVSDLLKHPQEIVRKKTVMALHAFFKKNPQSVESVTDALRRSLCDRDPSVMGASLHLLHELAMENPHQYKDLVSSFVSILKQIVEHRLPRDYDYHRVPAPWVQIKLLRILATLGAGDQRTSEGMYEILNEVIRKADTGINIGYAVIYETVRTITEIYPNTQLLETAASSISRFITSDSHNLKYLGITALANIVQVNSKYAAEHQMIVIDCLEDPDETLKRKTLDLLYRMTNPANVVIVADKLMNFLRSTVDVYLRTELVSRITSLAERYAPDNNWFIKTMNTVFELGGDLVRPEVAHNLMRLIAEGTGDDDEGDMQMRKYAVDSYTELMERPVLPDSLIQVISWVLGEYGYLSESCSVEDIIESLSDLIHRQLESPETRSWIITGLMKLVAQSQGQVASDLTATLEDLSKSRSVDIQQRCYEFRELVKTPNLMCSVLPVDASCEDIEVDPDMSFLDHFVSTAISNGAKCYIPPEEREQSQATVSLVQEADDHGSGLRFDAYQKPTASNTYEIPLDAPAPLASGPGGGGFGAPAPAANPGGLNTSGVTRKWGPEGFMSNDPAPAAAAPAAAPTGDLFSGLGNIGGQPAAAPAAAAPSLFGGAPKQPEKPAPSSAKQQLAASLFGGMTTTDTSAAAAPKVRSTKPKKDRKTKDAAPAAAPQASVDLLDLSDDFFGGVPTQPVVQPQAAAPPAAAKPSGGADDIMSMFDSAVGLGSTMAPAGGNDLLKMDTLLSSAPITDAPAKIVDPTCVPLAPGIRGLVEGSPKLFDCVQTLCGDHTLNVSQNRIFKNDESLVLLQLTNLSTTNITNSTTHLDAPANLHADFGGEPMPAVPTPNTLSFPSIAPGASVFLIVQYKFKSHIGGHHMVLKGTCSYTDGLGKTHEMPWTLNLPLSDILRPVVSSTADFGAKWGEHGEEKKIAIPTSVRTMEDYKARVAKRLNIHFVEAIGTEAIACGRLINSDLLCFVHSKVGGATLETTVRTKSRDFTENMSRHCAAVLGN